MAVWMERAACRGMDPEMWFPDAGQQHTTRSQAARAVCARCPVRRECLAVALAVPGYRDHGIWGGTLVAQRHELRKQARQLALLREDGR